MPQPITNFDPKRYIVLGAPRSGTTFLARALQMALVAKHGPGIGNRMCIEGNRVVSINRRTLELAGGDMWTPPNHDRITRVSDRVREDQVGFLGYMRQDYWGFKDPRTCFTLPLWDDVFDHTTEDVYAIGIFRKPWRSAGSLVRLGQGEGDQQALVEEYQRRALQNIARFIGMEADVR